MRYRAPFIFFFLLLPGLFLFAPKSALSQESAGVSLSPTVIERSADPGDIIEETLVIKNESSEEKEYFLFKRNIKGVEGSGVPIFAEDDLEVTGYELSEWVTFSAEAITLSPNEEIEIPVTIAVPENASPGSHFGGIFISAEPPRLREIGAGVGYEVAAIVSIRISGAVIDDARIRSFSTDKLFYGSKDVAFTARVENQGNILIRPRGPLTITNMFGGDPEVIIVNDSGAGVFPGTIRDFSFNWGDAGLGFGRYEAVLALSYEGNQGQKTITASLYFWVLPANVLIPVFIAFVVLAIGGWIAAKIYVNRAIVRGAGGRRIASSRYRRRAGISRLAFVFVTLMTVFVLFLILLLILFA